MVVLAGPIGTFDVVVIEDRVRVAVGEKVITVQRVPDNNL